LIPFFRLTSAFFGLTSQFKKDLWEEIFVCTQNNFTYSDVLMMSTAERRFHLGMILKVRENIQENIDNNKNVGNNKKIISGEALKNQIKNGHIPLN
jgi:hypothetical protein